MILQLFFFFLYHSSSSTCEGCKMLWKQVLVGMRENQPDTKPTQSDFDKDCITHFSADTCEYIYKNWDRIKNDPIDKLSEEICSLKSYGKCGIDYCLYIILGLIIISSIIFLYYYYFKRTSNESQVGFNEFGRV